MNSIYLKYRFIFSFDKFNASLLNKSIIFFKKNNTNIDQTFHTDMF